MIPTRHIRKLFCNESVAALLLSSPLIAIFAFWFVPATTNAWAAPATKLKAVPAVRVAPATVLSVKMVAYHRPDPMSKGERVDVFAAIVRNDGHRDFVRAILLAATFHHPSYPFDWPAVIVGTGGLKFVGAKPPVWQVPLAPQQTKTVYFVARSTRDDTYCVGLNDATWRCTS